MHAVGWLAERGFGKPSQVDRDGGDLLSELDLERLSREELISLREILVKANPTGDPTS